MYYMCVSVKANCDLKCYVRRTHERKKHNIKIGLFYPNIRLLGKVVLSCVKHDGVISSIRDVMYPLGPSLTGYMSHIIKECVN